MPPEAKVTVSAGGVVLNQQGMVLVVDQGTSWSLPKGHVDPGEEPVQAAAREIREESGVTELNFISVLGSYGRYKLGLKQTEDQAEWKVLVFYLFSTAQNELKPHDPRHPQACWVHPDKVEALLSHPKDKAFYRSIRSQIK